MGRQLVNLEPVTGSDSEYNDEDSCEVVVPKLSKFIENIRATD
jgi:hypothetical protein